MSGENGNDSLKRRIEALEQVVQNLQEKNQSWEVENKRLKVENLEYEVKIKKLEKSNDIMDSMGKLHESLKNRHFRIEKFIQNPGFQHIALSIFKKLDPKSLGNCRVVSKGLQSFIDSHCRDWYFDQL